MTTATGEKRCKFCLYTRRGWGDKFHKEGCPDVLHLDRGNSVAVEVELTLKAKREWEAGYAHGFDDNGIEPCRHSQSFLLGYKVGKAEIDELIEEAVEARNRDGEYL